jgi:peptide maturation system protein (TIGR04066 family)
MMQVGELMKKIVIFPYHHDLKTLVDYREMMKGYQLGGFISFIEDNKEVDLLNKLIGVEYSSYEQLISSCDALVLIDNYRDLICDKYYRLIEVAVSNKKEVLITPLAESQLDLNNYIGQFKLLEFLPENIADFEYEYKNMTEDKVFEISTPIIGILGQGKNCAKFKVQLMMKKSLEDDYNAVVVCSNALGVLFGCYSMPGFLYENRQFKEKILMFNHFIRNLARSANPDTIVIGIPEGILPFAKYEFHHFAEFPLVITNAVSLDLCVLCTYFLTGNELEFTLSKLGEFCKNKFLTSIDAFAISEVIYEATDEEAKCILYEYADDYFLGKYYPDLKSVNIPVLNLRNRNEAVRLLKTVIATLADNAKLM